MLMGIALLVVCAILCVIVASDASRASAVMLLLSVTTGIFGIIFVFLGYFG